MKKILYAFMLTVGTLAISSCNNDLPEFDDADAFAAFTSSSTSVEENVAGGELQIPVLLTSLSGIETSVDFVVKDSTAVEGKDFTIENTSKTLSFTKDEPTQYINIKIIDNDEYEGDKVFTVELTNPQGVNLGLAHTYTVKITDDEHPLAFILGSYTATGTSNFDGATSWNTLRIEKDDSDASKVWIYNICSAGCGSSTPVYGTVNDDKTEIHIPVGQATANSSSYDIVLEGFRGEEGEEDIATGDYILGYIASDGTITIQNWYGTHAYTKGTTTSAGWYDIMFPGVVWTKNQ